MPATSNRKALKSGTRSAPGSATRITTLKQALARLGPSGFPRDSARLARIHSVALGNRSASVSTTSRRFASRARTSRSTPCTCRGRPGWSSTTAYLSVSGTTTSLLERRETASVHRATARHVGSRDSTGTRARKAARPTLHASPVRPSQGRFWGYPRTYTQTRARLPARTAFTGTRRPGFAATSTPRRTVKPASVFQASRSSMRPCASCKGIEADSWAPIRITLFYVQVQTQNSAHCLDPLSPSRACST